MSEGIDIERRALEFKLQDADKAMLAWFDEAAVIMSDFKDTAANVALDETLSDIGRMEILDATREELTKRVDPIRARMLKRAGNIQAKLKEIAPTAEALEPGLRDRVVKAFTSASIDDRMDMLNKLDSNPQLARVLADEPLMITGILATTQQRAVALAFVSPDPAEHAKLTNDLTRLSDAGKYLDLKLKGLKD